MGGHFIQNSFNGGEWSKMLEGRVDLEGYAKACYCLENMLIDPRGPAVYRPGFRFIYAAKNAAKKCRLIPFEFSVTQAYQLEFGDQYIRFYKDQAIITSGGVPYEISSPYLEADLPAIKYCQSADVLYLFHPSYAPRKLSRTSHTSWVLSVINFRPGAIKEVGIEPAATLTLGAVTGTSVTFTAGSAVFQSGDVKRIITSGAGRASITSFSSTTQVVCEIIDDFASVGPIASGSWKIIGSPVGEITPSIKEPVGAICTISGSSGSETYTNLVSLLGTDDYWAVSSSGTDEYYLLNTAVCYTASKPSYVYINNTSAVESTAGTLGITQWAWGDNDTLGYNTIYVRLSDGSDPDSKSPDSDYIKMSVASATTDLFRSADVGKYIRVYDGIIKINTYTSTTQVSGEILKELSDTAATTAWTLEDEIWTADKGYPSCGTFFEDRLVLAGSTDYPETLWGSCVSDYENFIPGVTDSDAWEFTINSRMVNVIRWIEPREYLIVGTTSGEWRLGPDDTGSILTPTNVTAKQEQQFGSGNIMPVTIGSSTLFVQRALRKIREFTFQWESDGYVAPDMTLLAEHITKGNIAGTAYQKEPLSILWAYTEEGDLSGLTYLRDQSVVGWHRHPVDGIVESLSVIPGDGYDELWAVIQRTINGSTVRYIEMLEALFDDDAGTFTTNKGLNAFFVDCGYTYNGTATTSITGLSHLEGESVVALADGAYVTTKTVSSGAITLSKAASVVHVGLPYTGKLQTMRLDVGLRDGTAQGRHKRIYDLIARVYCSGPFKAGRDSDNLDSYIDRHATPVLGAPYALFTGDISMPFNASFDTDARLTVVQDKPLPLIVTALIEKATVKG